MLPRIPHVDYFETDSWEDSRPYSLTLETAYRAVYRKGTRKGRDIRRPLRRGENEDQSAAMAVRA